MWETLDGHVLRLSVARGAALAARHRLLGLTHLVRSHYQDDLQAATARAVGQLARGATRTGTLRRASTGRTYSVFTARDGGRVYRILARPAGDCGCESSIVSVRFLRYQRDYLDSHGHRLAQSAVVNALLQQGLTLGDGTGAGVIRDNRQQVDASGRPAYWQRYRRPKKGRDGRFTMPDVSYIGADGTRVNVEIETDSGNLQQKMRQLVMADPNSMHVSLLVDPNTGRVLGRHVYDPRRDRVDPARLRRSPKLLPGHRESRRRGALLPPPQRTGRGRRAPQGPQVRFRTPTTRPPWPLLTSRGRGAVSRIPGRQARPRPGASSPGSPVRGIPGRRPVPSGWRRTRPARESELMMGSLAFY